MRGPSRAQAVLVLRHEVYRRGLARMLAEVGVDVVGSTACAREGEALARRPGPDVVVVDELLSDGDGLQLVRALRAALPTTPVVLHRERCDDRVELAARLLGASAVTCRCEGDAIVDVVSDVVGEVPCAQDVAAAREVLDRLVAGGPVRVDGAAVDLTPQERRVFELVGQGLTNREVGHVLGLTEKTVKNYVSRLLARLGIGHRTQVARLVAVMSMGRGCRTGSRRPRVRRTTRHHASAS